MVFDLLESGVSLSLLSQTRGEEVFLQLLLPLAYTLAGPRPQDYPGTRAVCILDQKPLGTAAEPSQAAPRLLVLAPSANLSLCYAKGVSKGRSAKNSEAFLESSNTQAQANLPCKTPDGQKKVKSGQQSF